MAQFQTGCKKGWLDVNYNPMDITDKNATPDLILPALLEGCITTQDTRFAQQWMGYWCHYQAPAGLSVQTYNHVFAGDYGGFTGKPAPEIFYLEEKARQSGQAFYEGIAKVLRALRWSRCVDVVNAMPYTDAYNSKILQPRYDDGQYIYEDLLKQLDTASTLIKNAEFNKNIKISVSDIMFHGDQLKWLQFVNTLKLRLLVHQANLPGREAYITAAMAKIRAEGSGFLASGQDAAVNPGYLLGKKLSWYFGYFSNNNPYGGGDYDAVTGVMSTQTAHANVVAMNFLKASQDPRLGLFYTEIEEPLPPGAVEPFSQPDPQHFRGSKFGLYINNALYPYQERVHLSAIGGSKNNNVVTPVAMGIIKGRNMADWIMTSTESFFLQAEAIQRGWLPGNAEQAYKDAVKESFRWLNAGGNSTAPLLSDAVFDNWYATQVTAGNNQVSWSAAPDKYKLLMLQKYLAFNGIEPLEAWTDYRRNGRFPDIPASVDPARLGNTIPFRLEYDPNEYIVNTGHANAQGKINVFTGKIWWMP
jgi:hypothetical protein